MGSDFNLQMNKICRTCLKESSSMRSLLSLIQDDRRTILQVVSCLTNSEIRLDSKLPESVCNECEQIIYRADEFKRRCVVSQTVLDNFLHQSNLFLTVPSETSSANVFKKEEVESKHKISQLEVLQSSVCVPVHTNSGALPGHIIFKVDGDAGNCKEEYENEFTHYSDDSHSFGPIEFKNENSNTNDLTGHPCKCGNSFEKSDMLDLHLKSESCTKSSEDNLELEYNANPEKKVKYPNLNIIKCINCTLSFVDDKSYQIHLKKHKTQDRDVDDKPSKYQCSLCMRRFVKKYSLVSHIKRHELQSSIGIICKTCKREFKHRAHLDNHILSVHTREKEFSCVFCNENFSSKATFEIHKESHREEKKHQCGVCQRTFSMISSLKEHMRIHTGEQPFLCSICGRGFNQKNNLTQHMMRHQGLKPFKCENCEKRFVSKGELVAHTRKHTGDHPFVCDDCGNGFTTSSSLVKHRRRHTGERPYQCDLCPMRFTSSGTLKVHKRIHTNERPYQCSYCEKAFTQRQDLVSHIRCHTGERPFICTICGQSFRKASALKGHVKIHSKETL